MMIVNRFVSCNSPFPPTEEAFSGCLMTTYSPSPSMIGCSAINGTLIYKNKLIGLVGANLGSKVCPFFGTVFKGIRSSYQVHKFTPH